MTKAEQLRVRTAYIKVKDALDEIAQIRTKDAMLTNVQHSLYRLEDTLWQYMGPMKEEKKY